MTAIEKIEWLQFGPFEAISGQLPNGSCVGSAAIT
jgi:hypothetical protein